MRFISSYGLSTTYATSDQSVTRPILDRYSAYLLGGFTIKDKPINASTIYGYLHAVNNHYISLNLRPPFDKSSNSPAALIIKWHKDFEKKAAKRDPLHYLTIARMHTIALSSPPHSFHTAVWYWTALGRLGGFRCQEFAMDKPDNIRVYIKPDGTQVVRAFTLTNFIFHDMHSSRITWTQALATPAIVHKISTEYDIQKNRVNGQLISFVREPRFQSMCPVCISLSILRLAVELGASSSTDPLCVYRSESGTVQYLTGTSITAYYRYVTKLVFPAVSVADLHLISTHSLRVTACVLLHEAGMDGSYIKLRLRWKSDCFEMYLRNSNRITLRHNLAITEDTNVLLRAIADISSNLLPVIDMAHLTIDDSLPDLNDED